MSNEKRSEDTVFNKLNAINVTASTDKKQGLTYLSWANAWKYVKRTYDNATYEVKKFDNSLPFVYDDALGFMVYTSVTINNETLEMWLPVMNGANKAMKKVAYTYKTKFGDKSVEPATMFDINKAIMRCLAKNISMFGLGLHIYTKDDLPEDIYVAFIDKVKTSELMAIAKGKNNVDEIMKTLTELNANRIAEIPAADYEKAKSLLSAIEVLTDEAV